VHRPAGKEHSAVLAFSSELDGWLDSRPIRQAMNVDAAAPAAVELRVAELQALFIKAEAALQKIDALLIRTEQLHNRLFDVIDGLPADGRRELRNGVRSRRLEAGAA
jgi:hypothetical protein